MKKLDLMELANRFYPDAALASYYDVNGDFVDTPDGGDGLARFIVAELEGVFPYPDRYRIEADEVVLREATNLMHTAIGDILSVIAGLDQLVNWRGLTSDE